MAEEKTGQVQNPLATESIPRLMLKYSVPSVVSMLVMSLYNIVDQIFIGHGVGYLGNAATTVAFPIVIVGLALALLAGNGSAAYISLELGRGNSDNARKIFGNSIFMLIILSGLLTLLSLVFLEPLLRLFGATDAVMPYAIDFTGIIMIGMPFSMFSVAASNAIRADGSPHFSMISTLSGVVLNTILAPIFIFVFHMGVKGAAIATVISQVFSFVLTLYYVLHKAKYVRLIWSDIKPDAKIIQKIAALGSSSFVNQVTMFLVMLVLNRSITYYGASSPYGSEIPLAAFGIVMKINAILISIILGTSIGLQPILGFNYGSKNYARVRHAFKIGVTTTSILALIVNILLVATPSTCIGIFGDPNPQFNEFATHALRIMALFIVAAGIQIPCALYYLAVGKPLKSMMLTLLRTILILIPLSLIFPLFWGLNGLLYAGPTSDVLALIVSVIFILIEMRSLNKLEEQPC